jgi:hypothetical protein
LGAIDTSLKFVAFRLIFWQTSRSWFLPAAQIKNGLYFSSKLGLESVWIGEGK